MSESGLAEPNRVLTDAIGRLASREDLDAAAAERVLIEVMEGRAGEIQTAALLIALRTKGETVEEIAGLASAMRSLSRRVECDRDDLLDTAGTGGGTLTFNVSTTAALVAAGAGCAVAKHGNRSATSKSGSADVLTALGARIDLEPEAVGLCISEIGFGFMFAPLHHPAMRHVVGVRKALGVQTVFNLLGPLTNPAAPARQLVGVPRPELTELIARSLLRLGSDRAWVVHGADGLDELSTTGYTKVSECRDGTVQTFYVHPADYGLAKSSVEALQGGEAAENARLVRDVLDGRPGPARTVVLLNAGAALFIAGRAASIRAGVAEAGAAIDEGRAKAVLEKLIAVSQSAGAAAS